MSSLPETTDVCLIVEGTYPYVRGGVSSWIHSLVTGIQDITFSILMVSADRHQKHEMKYQLPPNVRTFAEVYIHEAVNDAGPSCPAKARARAWETMKAFHLKEGHERRSLGPEMLRAAGVPGHQALSFQDAFYSREAWDFLVERYREKADGTSFIDYFWTWRSIHAPLFQTAIAEIPPARVYHPVSTGYAGLLGVLGKLRYRRPLVLTEHGLYVRERVIDIARAEWIHEEPVRVRAVRPEGNPLKQMWTGFFTTLGELTYDAADEIIALFGDNMTLQQQLGASPKKTRVIPNGVEVEQYAPLRSQRKPEGSRPLRVGFVGRVVPIKDVKTLLKACAKVHRSLPDVEFWVVGPTDENVPYFEECKELCALLGLAEKLRFTGPQDVKKIYPELDVMVLTSISEGQPLSILEAACAGVPTVATDVGSCRELLEGRTNEDRALGVGGLVTGVGAPDQTAAAILKILNDLPLRQRMSEAGVKRTEQFYRQSMVIDRYRELYRRHIAATPNPVSPTATASASEERRGD